MKHLNKQSQYFAGRIRSLKQDFDESIADLEEEFDESVARSQ